MTAATPHRISHRLAVLAVAGLTACQAGVNPPAAPDLPEIITLAASTQCAHSEAEPAASWLDTAAELQEAYRRMTRQTLGASSLPGQTPDFAQYGILQVFMGQQTTGGYQLRLLDPRLVQGAPDTAVRLEWLAPSPGALTPQVMTSPCLLLAVPRGSFRALNVTDQHGRIRAVAER